MHWFSRFTPVEKTLGIIGSLASVVGLLLVLLPSEPTHSQDREIRVEGGDYVGGNKVQNIGGHHIEGDNVGRDKNVYIGNKPGYFVADQTLVALTDSPPSFSDFEAALRENQYVYAGLEVELDESAQPVQDKRLPLSYVRVRFLDGALKGKQGWISQSKIEKR